MKSSAIPTSEPFPLLSGYRVLEKQPPSIKGKQVAVHDRFRPCWVEAPGSERERRRRGRAKLASLVGVRPSTPHPNDSRTVWSMTASRPDHPGGQLVPLGEKPETPTFRRQIFGSVSRF